MVKPLLQKGSLTFEHGGTNGTLLKNAGGDRHSLAHGDISAKSQGGSLKTSHGVKEKGSAITW